MFFRIIAIVYSPRALTPLDSKLQSTIKLAICALMPCLSATMASADDARKAHVTPAQVKSAIDKLEELANETLKRTNIPGIAIAVVHRDQVVYKQGFGVREAG